MSVFVLSKVWSGYPGESSVELLALLALADWSDDEGRSFPSISAIARKCRIKPRQAQRIAHRLIESGLVSVLGNASGGAPGSSRKYRINLEALTGVINDRGVIKDTGVKNDADGCHLRRETGVENDTLYVIDTSLTVNTPAKPAGAYSASFEEFWKHYPNRVNKGSAFKAWKKIKASEHPAIMSGLASKKNCPAWRKENGRFIPHAATWLNARGWEDEDAQPSGGGDFDMGAFLRKVGGVT